MFVTELAANCGMGTWAGDDIADNCPNIRSILCECFWFVAAKR
jgi:hypothetical protein